MECNDDGPRSFKCTFIVQVIDRALGQVVLESRIDLGDVSLIAEIIGADLSASSGMLDLYYPTPEQMDRLCDTYDLGAEFSHRSSLVRLHDIRLRGALPYIPHGELSLSQFWDGTKKFGYIEHRCPPDRYDREDEIDAAVSQGYLRKFVCGADGVCRPGYPLVRSANDMRRVLLTRPQEDWRAMAYLNLIESSQMTRWSELAERQLSSLFGYEDWQTDCWIEYTKTRRGSFSGLPIIFGVSRSEIENIWLLGGKAFLPDVGSEVLKFFRSKEYGLPSKSEVESGYDIDLPFVCWASVSFALLKTVTQLAGQGCYQVARSDMARFNQSLNSDINLLCELD